MKTEKELAQWLDDRHKRLTDIVDKALGYHKEKAKKPVNKKTKKIQDVEYLMGTYFPTGDEPKNYKPPFDIINPN
jgi:hypothetical protein